MKRFVSFGPTLVVAEEDVAFLAPLSASSTEVGIHTQAGIITRSVDAPFETCRNALTSPPDSQGQQPSNRESFAEQVLLPIAQVVVEAFGRQTEPDTEPVIAPASA